MRPALVNQYPFDGACCGPIGRTFGYGVQEQFAFTLLFTEGIFIRCVPVSFRIPGGASKTVWT